MIWPLLLEAAAETGDSGLELPNFVTFVGHLGGHAAWAQFMRGWVDVIFTWIVIFLLALFFRLASRHKSLVPGPLQNLAEVPVEKLHDLIVGVMGTRGRRYVPFLGSIFIFILTMNLIGLVPLFKSPTTNLNTTLAMALVVFFYVQWTGIRRLGIVGYLDHLAGQPRDPIGWAMVVILLPVHVIGELAKPVSLSCRLFGNIFGEDAVIAVFIGLGVSLMGLFRVPWFGLPIQLPILALALVTSVVQALIFTLLTTIYLYLMLPHEHEHKVRETNDALAPGYPVHPEAA